MQISIILVNYNTKDITRNCLKSLLEKVKDVNFEVYVVDNDSSDGSCEMIKQEFPEVKLIENKDNKGFGSANNTAIMNSKAKYIFLLNTDTILVNNAVKILYDFMENPKNQNIACCGGNLYNEDMTHQTSYGVFPSLKHILFVATGLHKIFPKYFKNKLLIDGFNENNELKEVDYITGANMFIRKVVLDKVGLFDEDFFLYFEETELSFRFRKNGYKSIIIPDAKIIHLCGKSFKGFNLQKEKIWKKSEFLFFEKCYGKVIKYIVKFLYYIIYIKSFLFNNKLYSKKMLKILIRS